MESILWICLHLPIGGVIIRGVRRSYPNRTPPRRLPTDQRVRERSMKLPTFQVRVSLRTRSLYRVSIPVILLLAMTTGLVARGLADEDVIVLGSSSDEAD